MNEFSQFLGVLIVKKKLFKHPVPEGCGGGSVFFVSLCNQGLSVSDFKTIQKKKEGCCKKKKKKEYMHKIIYSGRTQES